MESLPLQAGVSENDDPQLGPVSLRGSFGDLLESSRITTRLKEIESALKARKRAVRQPFPIGYRAKEREPISHASFFFSGLRCLEFTMFDPIDRSFFNAQLILKSIQRSRLRRRCSAMSHA